MRVSFTFNESSTKLERKTLSVVIPNYNAAKYLAMQLEAVCRQSYPPDQVIVIDDGSNDESVEVIDRLAQEFPTIHLLRNSENKGVIYSINRGAKQATGEYIYFSSSNDLVLPEFFEKSMALLSKYPQAGICCADVVIRDEVQGITFDHLKTNWLAAPGFLSPEQLARATSTREGLYAPVSNTCIIKRSLLPENEIYMPSLECFCDWFLYQTVAFRHGVCFIPEKLVAVRVLPQSYSQSVLNDDDRIRSIFVTAIVLLSTPQFQDIVDLFIQGKSFLVFRTYIRSPLTAWRAVRASRKSGSASLEKTALSLFNHLASEWVRQVCKRAMKLFIPKS